MANLRHSQERTDLGIFTQSLPPRLRLTRIHQPETQKHITPYSKSYIPVPTRHTDGVPILLRTCEAPRLARRLVVPRRGRKYTLRLRATPALARNRIQDGHSIRRVLRRCDNPLVTFACALNDVIRSTQRPLCMRCSRLGQHMGPLPLSGCSSSNNWRSRVRDVAPIMYVIQESRNLTRQWPFW